MHHPRLPPKPDLLRDFYESTFTRLGAVTERPWHDRLSILAEGAAARVWPDATDLVDAELHFPPPETTAQRDAAREIFPGCPLTFQLVEVVLREVPSRFRQTIGELEPKAPERPVAEKLLRQQLHLSPMTRLKIGEFRPAWHFSAVVSVRAEVAAIDQSWHALRLAFDLETGEGDPHLEKELEYLASAAPGGASPPWPAIDETSLAEKLKTNLLRDLEGPLATTRARQERHLARELARITEYFSGYRKELQTRLKRQRTDESRQRFQDRIEASNTEETRRRDDQIHRHESRLIPHVDALMLTAERAWQTSLALPDREVRASYLPRARHWFGL
jgi:hypothetical protein